MSLAVTLAFFSASRQAARVEVQMSSGSCSTQPEAGKCCGNSACAFAAMEMSLRNTIAREEVVPWSMARTKDMEATLAVPGEGHCVAPKGADWRRKVKTGKS